MTRLPVEERRAALVEAALRAVARQQYRACTAGATRLLQRAAEVSGATTAWLVDRDSAATGDVRDAAVGQLVAQHAAVPA